MIVDTFSRDIVEGAGGTPEQLSLQPWGMLYISLNSLKLLVGSQITEGPVYNLVCPREITDFRLNSSNLLTIILC